jgi:two-component system chemotaxis sensor kinase CheA
VAADPYRYFRIEAHELVENTIQGLLELERGSTDATLLVRLLRYAHTLKGAARVVRRIEIAELSHALEDVLARARDGARTPSADEQSELFALVDRLSASLAELDAPTTPEGPRAPVVEAAGQTVRVEVEAMDAVLGAIGETGVELAALKRELLRLRDLGGLAGALASRLALGEPRRAPGGRAQILAAELRAGLERATQGLEQGVARVEQELADVREGVDRLRLVPAEALFQTLAGAVRDAARTLGKQAEFTATGGALRLDAHVLGPLRDALLHLVRNAVAHGIEPPAERAAAGKPERGRVELGVERRGDRVVFACDDDGRGVDVAAVRRELVRRELASVAEANALDDDGVLARLLSAGISTTANANQISGRGVGLDVVRETAARLQGQVSVRSRPGRGTHIELSVPITLAAVKALVVESAGTRAAIPLDAVEQTLRCDPSCLARGPAGEALVHGGKVIPFAPLTRVLGQRRSEAVRRVVSAVVLADGDRRAAIGVDRLLGTADIVVRPLPLAVRAAAVVAGAALDPEGNPELVLDPVSLVGAASLPAARAPLESAPDARLPLLVIDDSLTTRMLEQSILESAGYAVELAVSGEDGLEKALKRRYALFLVDVEMPGMNGFEFLERTRAEAELCRVPALLVTSRSDPEDFARGERAGASGYIVKGEFDQNLLLDKIRKLVGS